MGVGVFRGLIVAQEDGGKKGPFGFVGEGLRRTDIAAKEWIGLVAYYLTGKTDSLLPAPHTPAG